MGKYNPTSSLDSIIHIIYTYLQESSMKKRRAIIGDRIKIVRKGLHNILIPQHEEEIEIIVENGMGAEIEYNCWEWKLKRENLYLPQRFTVFKEVAFFYIEKHKPVVIVGLKDNKNISINDIRVGTKFVISKQKRCFRKIEGLFRSYWTFDDEAIIYDPGVFF